MNCTTHKIIRSKHHTKNQNGKSCAIILKKDAIILEQRHTVGNCFADMH